MSYTPTEWAKGDVITSEKLNKIENGIASAGGGTNILFAAIDTSTMALDKTWQELANAEVAYITFGLGAAAMHMPVIMTTVKQNNYFVIAFGVAEITNDDGNVNASFEPMLYVFKATSADGYPVFQMYG